MSPFPSESVTRCRKKCNIQVIGRVSLDLFRRVPVGRHSRVMEVPLTTGWIERWLAPSIAAVSVYRFVHVHPVIVRHMLLLQRHPSRRNDIYNILWAVVFGFATLNILSLAARRFEPNRRGLTFGELMAVLIVLLSIFLLGWELLEVFHIFPIKLQR